VTKQTIIKLKIFVLSHSPRQGNNQSSFVAVIYIYDNNDKTVFSTISSHQLSKERCSLQLRVVEFKKWRIDFKKQDALTFIFYFQKKEKEKTKCQLLYLSRFVLI
jgi:hypothetical protein